MQQVHTALPRIERLPAGLINQIAAGEVIERPASIVKELIENSLDANADRIEIEIEKGGLRLIRIRDNGHGMHKDDLPLSIQSHTTSKIRRFSDIAQVASLGFRGEALPSISSVSRFSLHSRQPDTDSGWCIHNRTASAANTPLPDSHPQGTTVEVRDLFYNVPARRKFLRTEKTEFSHIEQTVKYLALCYLDVGISLKHNAHQVLSLKPAHTQEDRERRVAAICGKSFIEQALYIEYEAAGLRLTGWISTPALSRKQGDRQYCSLNGRMVRDKVITHAVRQAYHDLLAYGQYPMFVLHLEMPPAGVDVNVHPAKQEVRFSESRLVHDFIYQALRKALSTYGGPSHESTGPGTSVQSYTHTRHHIGETLAAYSSLYGRQPETASVDVATEEDGRLLGHAFARFHDRYILAENTQGLVMVDIFKAWQIVAREQLASNTLSIQPLLIPQSVHIDEAMADVIDNHASQIARAGIALERISHNTVLVRALPAIMAQSDLAALVTQLLNGIKSSVSQEVLLDNLSGYCTFPVTSLHEMNDLLRQLESTPLHHSAWIQLSPDDIAALFQQRT